MKKPHANRTTKKNLEEKFDRGENVLDYFDVRNARLVDPRVEHSVAKGKFGSVQRNSNRRPAVVREKSARFRKKK